MVHTPGGGSCLCTIASHGLHPRRPGGLRNVRSRNFEVTLDSVSLPEPQMQFPRCAGTTASAASATSIRMSLPQKCIDQGCNLAGLRCCCARPPSRLSRTHDPAASCDRICDGDLQMSVTIMTVKCPHCNTRQKVHIIGRTSASQMAQYVKCLDCQQPFEVMLPDKIVAGPFPA